MSDNSAVRVSGDCMDKLYRLASHLHSLGIKPVFEQAVNDLYDLHAPAMSRETKKLTWKQYKLNKQK